MEPIQPRLRPLFPLVCEVLFLIMFSASRVFYIHPCSLGACGWYRPHLSHHHQPTQDLNKGIIQSWRTEPQTDFIFLWTLFSLSIPLSGITVVGTWLIAQLFPLSVVSNPETLFFCWNGLYFLYAVIQPNYLVDCIH